MPAIIIVSGCPGSGKTTLARSLARSHPRGLHLRSDVFYGFPVALVDPTRPESHEQNAVIIRAVARSAVHAAIPFAAFSTTDPIFRFFIVRALWVCWERAGQPDTKAIRRRWPARPGTP